MKYPLGIQSFVSLRQNGYYYIDKTRFAYRMANEGKCYFLSRPRRFGKSLFLTMLRAYFEGRKELFHGLELEQLEKEWTEYPVFYMSLNNSTFTENNSVGQILHHFLCGWEKLYGVSGSETTYALRFGGVIQRAFEQTGKPVVFLVDEYDKPLLQTIDNPVLQDQYRTELKAFYSVLKDQDEYVRFAFLTGVSKFSKVSIFSDLNNLNDISLDRDYAEICGMTDAEIHANFDDGVELLAQENGMTKDECYLRLRKEYDGYHFADISAGMYNPYSLINTLSKRQFKDYWFETGTPTYLVKLLKDANFELRDLEGEIDADTLQSVDMETENPLAVIYQSGYLTIKGYDTEFMLYRLGFPNGEVERGFTRFLMPAYLPMPKNRPLSVLSQFVREIRIGDPECFMQRLDAFLAGGNYQIAGDAELYFQNAIFLIFRFMGYYVQAEYASSDGRMDMIVQTSDFIYIFEFKLDKSADEALAQIEKKGYADQFAFDKRKLFKVGVNFSSETRRIQEWKVG
ncbi:MAG: ATP-binding protein [Bacteroidaceae bacterium]|nr:ATP-binding protein [Bacteroidaceae bacterium]